MLLEPMFVFPINFKLIIIIQNKRKVAFHSLNTFYTSKVSEKNTNSIHISLYHISSIFPCSKMNFLQSSIMFKKNCGIVLITIIFVRSILVESLSSSAKSKTCEPIDCGNGLNILHPFWIPEQQDSSCGSPGFEITCSGETPVLKISNDNYVVRGIFYSNSSILLANSQVLDENNSCPTPMHNFSTIGSPFNSTDSYADLYFFYNCTIDYESQRYPVRCASNASHYSFAVFHEIFVEESKNYSFTSCQHVVNTPVTGDDLRILLQMNYTDILRKGFVVQWCSDCKKKETGANVKLKVIIGITAGVFGIFATSFGFFLYLRRKKNGYKGSSYFSRGISSLPSSTRDLEKDSIYRGVHIFKYSELEKATNHFDSKKELGDGGFGTVYQGNLKDGRTVAVKRLYENNYKRVEQFMNEVEILAHLRHPNLVSLYGCTSHHGRGLLLVYEYIPNGTVADHLHGDHAKPGSLTWTTRLSIAVETATALSYLHASDVVHRDVKTNNILLDNNFCVKVADFGLSRLFPNNVTHVSTAPQGTPGYVDPEYHECYQLTSKSDVFSFGVVLIELISSMPAVDITRHRHEINLSNMAINKIRNDALEELVDRNLGYDSDIIIRKMINSVAELAFRCLQNDKEIRPSMEEVLNILKEIQNEGKNGKKTGESEVLGEDAILVKNNPQILSPYSVAVTWKSSSSASNSSG